MGLALAALMALSVRANSIDIRIAADRKAEVHERFSGASPAEFVFLASPCARIDHIQSADGHVIEPQGVGPWRRVAVPAIPALEISYEVLPIVEARTCSVPLLIPTHPIDPVSIAVTNLASGLSLISAPHLTAHRDSTGRNVIWTATLPAAPSALRLEWETGNPPTASVAAPTGRFAWNFWGLCAVLVIWTTAYLVWALRHAS